MRAAVDVMGGDRAPEAILAGCWQAAGLLEAGDVVYLVGDKSVVDPALAEAAKSLPPEKLALYKPAYSTQTVAMDESPVEAVRGKPDSSIAVMYKLCADKQADVAISAGNTGACVAGAQLRLRTLPGVSRPGIAVTIPTSNGPVILCDVGANPEPKAKHFHEYALMASVYASAVAGFDKPRVGLLSIGEEDSKGNSMTKESRKLLRDEPNINFIGNVEGKDLFKGIVDVVICDGFVGNIVLKFTEGLSEGLMATIVSELQTNAPELLQKFKPLMKNIYAKHDWQEYGGAPLLGVGGYVLICHGRSEAKAIMNAIRVGKQIAASGINEKIVALLGQDSAKAEAS